MNKRISRTIIKNYLFLAVIVLFLANSCIYVKASQQVAQDVKINDIIRGDTGELEIVIRVLENGEYITIPFQAPAITPMSTECQHLNLSAYSSYKQTAVADTSSMCYKVRTISESKCMSCGKTGFKNYGTWTNRPHDFPVFGNTCRTCGKSK